MLSSVTLNDQNGNPVVIHQDVAGGKRWLTGATGLRGIANLRNSDTKRSRPQAHGGINETKFEDGRGITLTGEVMSTIGIEDAFNEFGLVMAPIIQTLDSGPALLKWTEGATGNLLQRLVKLDGDLEPPFSDGQAVLSYQAIFYAEDPRAYSQSFVGDPVLGVSSIPLATAGGGHVFNTTYPRTYASSGGGTVSFTNGGNRPTPALYRIYGMAVNPQIVFLTTGQRLVFNGTVPAGSYLEIDSAARTVKLNGQTNLISFYDTADSSWFELPAGTSNLQLIAASFDSNAVLTILGRSAWA